VIRLAPRAQEESVRPRRPADTSARPLSFTVRRHVIPATLTPRRKVALTLALAWFFPSLAFMFYTLHLGGEPPFLRWPFVVTTAWTLATAAACGIIVAETARYRARAGASWSDKKHLQVALSVALTCLVIQWVPLVLASFHGGTRAF